MPQPVVLGVDVGATKVLVGAVARDGTVYHSRRYPVRRETQEQTLASVELAVESFLGGEWGGPSPLGIGVGLVGLVDPASGVWLHSLNMRVDTPVPLGARLRERHGWPVALDNDVHAATLAELRLGAGRGARDFVYLNVGTGIAAGVVCNGQLVRGAANYAGELGHMVVETDGDLCPCGRRGCLEPIASGDGIAAQARAGLPAHPNSLLHAAERAGTLSASAVFRAADAGDALASAVAGRAVRALGAALTNVLNLLNPEVVVLGGGVCADGWLLPRLRERVTSALPGAFRALRAIALSELAADRVGLLGAATLAWEQLTPGGNA